MLAELYLELSAGSPLFVDYIRGQFDNMAIHPIICSLSDKVTRPFDHEPITNN